MLPIYTGSSYVFTEPKLEADKHIMLYSEKSTVDKPIVHFRPAFGNAGGENVREAYLDGKDSGITMSAYITSTDLQGNKYNLQYNGREEIVLDGMFDDMYDKAENRGQMIFSGFEKYQSLEITLKITSGAVTYTLPTYTINNSKITKHFVSDFTVIDGITNAGAIVDEQLKVDSSTAVYVNLDNPISTGAGKTLVMDRVIVVANFTNSQTTTTINVSNPGEWTNLLTGSKVQVDASHSITLAGSDYIVLVK
jgi:hypothetical protein